MSENIVTIRKGTRSDAAFLAKVVLMALHENESHPMYGIFEELAARQDAQYSFCNALIAEVDGVAAGAIIGYDGAKLQELRVPLLQLVKERQGRELNIENETSAGEFYLDSLAVLPEYRSCGIGRMLLCAARDKAFADGFERVGLLVDFNNPRAERLYTSLGFRRISPTKFLGLDMWHMQVCQE